MTRSPVVLCFRIQSDLKLIELNKPESEIIYSGPTLFLTV